MSKEIRVQYNENCTPDGNHSSGPPEIIVPYPKEAFLRPDLSEYLEIALNENSYEVAEIFQQICYEGYPEVDVVEQNKGGEFIVAVDEVIHHLGIDDRSHYDIRLSCRYESDGVHFFLSEDAVLSYQHWLGEPDDY
jgi:hypothetical protein